MFCGFGGALASLPASFFVSLAPAACTTERPIPAAANCKTRRRDGTSRCNETSEHSSHIGRPPDSPLRVSALLNRDPSLTHQHFGWFGGHFFAAGAGFAAAGFGGGADLGGGGGAA